MASWFIWGLFRECARALSDTTNLLVLLLALSTRPTSLTMGYAFWHRILSDHITDDFTYGSAPGLIEAEGICP